jgi:RHS repeat-associated protein
MTGTNKEIRDMYSYDLRGSREFLAGDQPVNSLGILGSIGIRALLYSTYLRARWYGPSMGMFISEDTYEGELNNPLSLNLYTYVENNPLRYVDPSGHKPQFEERDGGGAANPNAHSVEDNWVIDGFEIFTPYGVVTTFQDDDSSYADYLLALAGILPVGKAKYLLDLDLQFFARYTGDLLKRSKNDFSHIKDVKQIEKKFGLDKGSYHPSGADGIKIAILAELNMKGSKFKNQMNIIGKNPDLYFANDGQIMVVSTVFKGKSFVTDLNIFDYN